MAERKTFLWVVLIILSSTTMTESMLSECKRPWVSIYTSCCNFDNLSLSFEKYSDAAKSCPPNSRLVDIQDVQELELLSRIVKARLSSGTPLNGIWTSGSRISNMEDYFWEISAFGALVKEKKKVVHFAFLNKSISLQNRKNHIALAFDWPTDLLGYLDVNSDLSKGLGVVCKAIVCPPPICSFDKKCVPVNDSNGCTFCTQCGGNACKVQVDVESDGFTACTTCYCKKECDDVEKCSYGCRLVSRVKGCPICECPAVVVPLDVQLKFTTVVPNAVDLVCRTVNKLIEVSEICTKRVVLRCRPTANLKDEDSGPVPVTVAIVTLSIRTSYPNFLSILNDCKYFLENNLLSKIRSHTVQNVLIEVPNYMPPPPPVTQSTCLKQKDSLPCDDTNQFYELRWEFNSRIGYCRPYIHNGCQSDEENSFSTLQECLTSCSEARCFLPRNPGSCGVYSNYWTHNPYTGTCERFKACEFSGNSNSFLTENECYSACNIEICAEPADVGPCSSRSVEPRYHYDTVTNECNIFNWGGCFGNGNQFESHDSCERRCTGVPINLKEATTTPLVKAISAVKTTADPQNLSTIIHHVNRGNIK